MTTTPTIWKSAFTANSAALAGSQTVPQSIGLANGNFLVVWQDDTDATRPFIDIGGQMYDAVGTPIGGTFQVNQSIWGSDETGPKLAAMADGGFVMAYGGYFEALGGIVTVERFNSLGQSQYYNVITDPISSLTDWDISADSSGNYTLALERRINGSIDVRSITYDNTGLRYAERTNVAQNSGDDDRLGAVAAVGDGRIVTFYTEPDDYWLAGTYLPPLYVDATTFEFTITDGLTGATIRGATEIADPETRLTGRALDTVVLTGGQIVLLYGIDRNGGELSMRIVGDGSASGAITPEIVVDATFSLDGDGGRGFANAHAVALQDGGFLVAWTIVNFLYAGRFNAGGTLIGTKLVVDQQVATGQTALFDLSLTSDGRVLVPFLRDSGEIGEVILDPRSNVIFGTEAGEVLTTQIGATVINGEGGDDTILGQGGNDFINGGTGFDTLHGGGGNDTYYLLDTTSAGDHDLVIENSNSGIDTVRVRPGTDPAILYFYALTANVENGVIDSGETFDLFGNQLANSLGGGAGGNFLFGNAGNDTLDGGGGVDNMFGGLGNDIYYADNASDQTNESAGQGTADKVFASVSYALGAGDEIEFLLASAGTTGLVLSGNELANRIYGSIGGADILRGFAGDDLLDGRAGADKMVGSSGNDTFFVDNAGDRIVELAGQGTGDRLFTAVNYVLAAGVGVEACFANAGATGLTITGNELANRITGNTGNDRLNGGIENDLLAGGLGADRLTGGADRDSFLFNTALGPANIDRITDFTPADDTIQLDLTIFSAAGGLGALAAGAFRTGPAAADASYRIIYNATTGALFYDANGNSSGSQIQFGLLAIGLTLSSADFVIV